MENEISSNEQAIDRENEYNDPVNGSDRDPRASALAMDTDIGNKKTQDPDNPGLDSRFWELDLLRGIALIIMIFYHMLYDLEYFGNYQYDLQSGYMAFIARGTASVFILLVGISLTLSFTRASRRGRRKQGRDERFFMKFLRRGLTIFSLGLVITFSTWYYLDEGIILFGVLHCIGISIILAYPFLKYDLKRKGLFLGIIMIIIGIYLRGQTYEFTSLIWLGFKPENSYYLDYFPLLPWFGVVLVGIFLGNQLYPGYKRRFRLPDPGSRSTVRLFTIMGKHSMVIYMVHQPILLSILWMLGLITL